MLYPRQGHRSITIVNRIIHIGGTNSETWEFPMEQWIREDDKFNKNISETTVSRFYNYPELFIVTHEFCE